jgi:hypothetical protein
MSIIPALRGLKQEDHKFKVSLSYIVRPCLKKRSNTKEKAEQQTVCPYLHSKYL